VQNTFDAGLVVMMVSLFILRGFGLGPGPDVSHTSPSGGVKFVFGRGESDVRFGLVPHFALGPIADVSNPASSGGDSLMFGVGVVNGWLDVGRLEIGDVSITSPSGGARDGVFRNGVDTVRGQDAVSATSSFQAHLPVLRATRGR